MSVCSSVTKGRKLVEKMPKFNFILHRTATTDQRMIEEEEEGEIV